MYFTLDKAENIGLAVNRGPYCCTGETGEPVQQ